MNQLKIVREFYKPIQPAIKAGNKDIVYQEVHPSGRVEDFIYCCWQLKTCQTLPQEYIYRVVSDGCIDIFWDQNQPSENFVMGFCRKYVEFPIGHAFNYVGIRFFPAAFPILFGLDAEKLSNQAQHLGLVLPELSEWISKTIRPGENFETTCIRLNEHLGSILNEQNLQFDKRFFDALALIYKKHGCLDIEKDLDIGLSPRQLRRLFNRHIGTTAKAFCNVVRFQHILNTQPSNQSLRQDKFYLDLGFFDQAHFIKHFKTFYGLSPSAALD